MTVDPSPDTVAEAMDLPPGVFAPRREGTVQLILGQITSICGPIL
jgi:hypothetical protein